MLNIVYHSQFKKGLQKSPQKRLRPAASGLHNHHAGNREALPAANRDHALTGNYKGMRECHIQPDWLLIYQIREEALILVLARTGSHSDLF